MSQQLITGIRSRLGIGYISQSSIYILTVLVRASAQLNDCQL
jgi:hypothetical protein